MSQVVDVAGSKALVGDVRGLLDELADVCAGVEGSELLASDAGRLVALSGALDRYVAGLRAQALGRVLEAKLWRDDRARSPQRWLAEQLGCTVSDAARLVRVAERLADQPVTAAAMRRGELSDHEADLVTAATEAQPDHEEDHLGTATGRPAGPPPAPAPDPAPGGGPAPSPGPGPAPGPGPGPDPAPSSGPASGGGRRGTLDELRRQREQAKARADADRAGRERRLHGERSGGKGPTDEGGWRLWARTTRGAGRRIDEALAVAMGELTAERKAKGLEPLTYGQLLADALVRMADKSLTGAGTDGPGPRNRAVLLADVTAVQRGWLEGDETCEIPGVGTISIPDARRLLGDSTLTLVLRKGHDVCNVTNLGPTFTDAQRAAIWARAGGICETPGCGATTGLQIDHAHETQHGGASHIDNAHLHCWADHQEKTHGRMRLIGPPARRAWIDLDQLPFDPARHGPIPAEQIEHLLPPPAPSPTARAGPAPPRPESPPDADPEPVTDDDVEQLDLLTC